MTRPIPTSIGPSLLARPQGCLQRRIVSLTCPLGASVVHLLIRKVADMRTHARHRRGHVCQEDEAEATKASWSDNHGAMNRSKLLENSSLRERRSVERENQPDRSAPPSEAGTHMQPSPPSPARTYCPLSLSTIPLGISHLPTTLEDDHGGFYKSATTTFPEEHSFTHPIARPYPEPPNPHSPRSSAKPRRHDSWTSLRSLVEAPYPAADCHPRRGRPVSPTNDFSENPHPSAHPPASDLIPPPNSSAHQPQSAHIAHTPTVKTSYRACMLFATLSAAVFGLGGVVVALLQYIHPKKT